MSKPRNKTNRRRLHYLGVLAAAGLLTMGVAATPAMAQSTVNNIGDSNNDVTVTGKSADTDPTANAWDGDVVGNVTFNGIYQTDGSTPTSLTTKVVGDSSATGDVTVDGTNIAAGGVTIEVETYELEVGGALGVTGTTVLKFEVDNGGIFSAGSMGEKVTVEAGAGAGNVTLGAVAGGTISNASTVAGQVFKVAKVTGNLTGNATNSGSRKMWIEEVAGGNNTYENKTGGGTYEIGKITESATGTNSFTNADDGIYIIGDIEAGTNNVYTNTATGKSYTVGNINGGSHVFTNYANTVGGNMTLAAISGATTKVTLVGTTSTNVTTSSGPVFGGATVEIKDSTTSLGGSGHAIIQDGGTKNVIDKINNNGDGAGGPADSGYNTIKSNGTSTSHAVTINEIAGKVKIGDESDKADTKAIQADAKALKNGADIVLHDGSEFDQVSLDGTIEGTVTVDNDSTTANKFTLGTMQNNATLVNNSTYDDTGKNNVTVSTAAGASGEGNSKNVTFQGTGITTATFGDYNKVFVEGGHVVAANNKELESLKVESYTSDGDASYTFNTGDTKVKGDLDVIVAGNNTVNNDKVTIYTNGANATVQGDVNLTGDKITGSETNKFVIVGNSIAIDNQTGPSTINIDGSDLIMDFSGISTGLGFTGVDVLNAGNSDPNTNTTIDFDGPSSKLYASYTDILGKTDFRTTVYTGKSATDATSATAEGVYTRVAIISGSTATMDGLATTGTPDSSKPTNQTELLDVSEIIIDSVGSLDSVSSDGYGTAISLVDLDKTNIDGLTNPTYFYVDEDVTGEFRVVDFSDDTLTQEDKQKVWDNLATLERAYGSGDGILNYNQKGTGLVFAMDQDDITSANNGMPKYAKGYANALFSGNNSMVVFADAIGNGYFGAGAAFDINDRINNNPTSGHQVLNAAMGQTLNAVHMVSNNALTGIMNNLNTLHPQTENRIATSAGDCETFGLWITPNFSYRSIDGNYSQGFGGDVDIKSYGLTVGFDGWINEQFRLGLFAGINSGDLSSDYQDIDGDDFQLGAYGQVVLPQGFMLNLGLAYSWQDYDADRYVRTGIVDTDGESFDQKIKSSFDGNTITAAIELNKTFGLDYNMFLRPAIGYTYMGTELDSYREKSSLRGTDRDLSQRVDETDYDLHLFRVGTDIGWAVENASIIGRAYYVGNAGDDNVNTKARFVNAPNSTFKIYGAEYDDSMANLGLTIKVAPTENTHFAIDYDALLGSNSETHNVNLTFKYEW